MALARLAERAIAAAEVAVAADGTVRALLAWCTEAVSVRVDTAKACLLCVAWQHAAVFGRAWPLLAWGRPVVLSPEARRNGQLEHSDCCFIADHGDRVALLASPSAVSLVGDNLILRAGCEAHLASCEV